MVTRFSSTSVAGGLAYSPALARVREADLVLAGTLSLIPTGQVTIPLPFTPVLITIGTSAALGVGVALGLRRDALSALLLGALTAAGAPILAGWSGGTVVTLGHAIGYVLIAAIAGCAVIVWLCHSGSTVARVTTGVALMLLASVSVYTPGLTWLKAATGADWGTTLYPGLVPFIMGDIFKSVVATGLLPTRSYFR